MVWKVYYDDGSVFDGDETKLPVRRNGVIAVAQPSETMGRFVVHGNDWYCLCSDGTWYGADLFGLIYRAMYQLPDLVCVLQGAMASAAKFNEIVGRARRDPGLPAKSAHHPSEGPLMRE